MKDVVHEPVLLQEALEYLSIRPDGVYVDCTLGDGGYSSEIVKNLENGKLYSFDVDEMAIENVKHLYETELKVGKWELIRENFALLKEELEKREVEQVDGVVFDLGMSSRQIDADECERGFSFKKIEPLDMRMDSRLGVTAEDLLRALSEKELEMIFRKYGEERYARRIAKAVKRHTSQHTTTSISTDDLAAIVRKVVPASYRKGSKHPSRRVFQALRIAVNDELLCLQRGLSSALSVVSKGGRVVVISYHSLEDRIVKRSFEESSTAGKTVLLTEKAVIPRDEEIRANPRSRSAKLRAVEIT